MDVFLNNNAVLRLIAQIKSYSDQIVLPPPPPSVSPPLSKEQAKHIIQQAWQGKKIKNAMIKSPFHSYLSMVDVNERQRQLSALMLGHHVAEQHHVAKEQIPNPFVSPVEYYHRSTPLDNPVLDALYKEFEIHHLDKENYHYIPISLLENNPIEDVLDLFSEINQLQLIKKAPHTIAVLIIPKSNELLVTKLKDKIRNMGLVASSWEIAENIRSTVLDIPSAPHNKIELDPNLPKTKEGLLASELMVKLKAISKRGKHYPTTHLAQCLRKLISDLPPNISSAAIQRIATMIDFTNTFYLYHYPRYALCIYYVLHEISLALVENTSPIVMELEYERYVAESLSTLEKTLSVNSSNLNNSRFLTTASTSGASACAIAMRIASTMTTPHDTRPKVKIFKPCYYELPNTFNLDSTNDPNEADVLMISAGPIVNPEGLTPGIDINLFLKHHVIDTKRSKPLTLIVDATTALYKNLRLNDEVQQLIAKGQLSIIVHESHQKFGLIHSDQAQYGRVFGWCSNKHFSQQTLDQVEMNTKADFFKHVDMRIGAFINTRCGETLEQIKIQHFSNGALLRNLLLGTSIISEHIEEHEDMQENLDELYFLTNQETQPGSFVSKMEYAAFGAVEYRNSFGHFALTTTIAVGLMRQSPDASDAIDNLALASHMRLAHLYQYTASKMVEALISGKKVQKPLTIEEQIVLIGMTHSIASFFPILPTDFNQIESVNRFFNEEDKGKIIHSNTKPKNIIISQDKTKNVTYLGFHSHGKVFRQIPIKDPLLLKMIEAGTINSAEGHSLVKNRLKMLQKNYLPINASIPLLYSIISQNLNYCPLLKKRPFIMDIKRWLDALEDKLIQEYKPQNSRSFLNGIKEFYPNTADEEANKYSLIFLSTIKGSLTPPSLALHKKDFIKAIKKVYEGNQQILDNLKDAPQKYKLAQQSGEIYLNTCFEALYHFYNNKEPNYLDQLSLIKSINKAEATYLQVLSHDRTKLSQIARYILKAITNFIAALSFGAAHYINYKAKGELLFFSGTRSENKLKSLDRELIEDIEIISPVAY
ncbi:hypothetical protein [Legionella sp. km772]|uniref:hypothetical protein n=1 Tax=Legionella sp. km772 TaxID=2498111 RepID=UPI000F8F4240|nr:hypothetical protein [Legionella sp. km772]RUR08330.1 hypothetical protein ELY15_11245 [Legionella sp. km772]